MNLVKTMTLTTPVNINLVIVLCDSNLPIAFICYDIYYLWQNHNSRYVLVESRECAACGVDGDLEHIVLECQRYGLQRLILVHELQLMHKTQE
jgi:hypothetical protein